MFTFVTPHLTVHVEATDYAEAIDLLTPHVPNAATTWWVVTGESEYSQVVGAGIN